MKRAGEAAHAGANEAFKHALEFEVPELDLQELVNALTGWYEAEGLESQALDVEGGIVVQCRRKGNWRKYVGMNSELTVIVKTEYPKVVVEVGAGKWLAKAGAGAVGLVGAAALPILFVPYLAGAAYGGWEQAHLRRRTIEIVHEVMDRYRRPTGEVP
jgi:hypothetical protein